MNSLRYLSSSDNIILNVGFQGLAHGDEGQDHGGGFKVELHHIVHDKFVIAIDLSTGHGKEGVSAPHKAGQDVYKRQASRSTTT